MQTADVYVRDRSDGLMLSTDKKTTDKNKIESEANGIIITSLNY